MLQLKKIVLFVVSIFLYSCSEDFFEKPIDLDLDNHVSKLAGTALLGSANETDLVLVSFSQGPFEDNTDNQILDNAIVKLSSNTTEIDFHKTSQTNFYTASSTINFVPTTAYTLTIDAPNYESISATQIYPEKVPVLEASITENTFKIKINDNPNQQNYYLLQLLEADGNGGYYERYIEPFGTLTDESGFCNSCVSFTDDTFNGEQGFEIVVTNDNYNLDSTYKAVLYHITEDFYRYDTTLRISEYAEDNPFVEPVILHRNFENGYGVFALVNTSEFVFNE